MCPLTTKNTLHNLDKIFYNNLFRYNEYEPRLDPFKLLKIYQQYGNPR